MNIWDVLRMRGFWIACLCLIVVTTSNGMINSGLSVYDEVLAVHFDVSIAQLKLRDSISFLASTVFIVIAGVWVDRFGSKPLLLAGLLLLSAVYCLYPLAPNLRYVYGLHGLFALILACAGNMTAIVTAAFWFPQARGLAIGMAVAGTSVGGMIIPPLAAMAIDHWGWQTAMRVQAMWPVLVFILVLVALPNARTRINANGSVLPASFAHILRSSAFYKITAAASLTYYAALSMFSHGFLYFRSLQLEPSAAAILLSILSVSALVGKLLTGYLSDRYPFDFAFRLQMLLMVAGLAVLLLGREWLEWAVVIAGYGWGGLHALYNIVLVRLFGIEVAGKVNGTVSMAEAVGGSLGIAATGYLATVASYDTAFGVALCLCILALMLVWVTPSHAGARKDK
jgi:predicted MFS family arabinose efflux permease